MRPEGPDAGSAASGSSLTSSSSRGDLFAPLPVGARDVLADDCRRRRGIADGLLSTFDRWGYEPVSTPAIELYDVFGRGLLNTGQRS